jgi:hypothetical protein
MAIPSDRTRTGTNSGRVGVGFLDDRSRLPKYSRFSLWALADAPGDPPCGLGNGREIRFPRRPLQPEDAYEAFQRYLAGFDQPESADRGAQIRHGEPKSDPRIVHPAVHVYEPGLVVVGESPRPSAVRSYSAMIACH